VRITEKQDEDETVDQVGMGQERDYSFAISAR